MAVLGNKAFHEPVPPQTRFVHLIRVNHFHIGKGYELHASGGYGVEARQQSTRQLCERKALITVAEVVSAGKQIARVKVVIDFSDETVDAVFEKSRRSQIRTAAAADIRSRPRMTCQEAFDH